MAHSVALRAARAAFSQVDTDEVRAVADQALLEAWERYDPARGCAFSTYAYPWIRGAALRAATGDRTRHAIHGPLEEDHPAGSGERGLELAVEARRALRRVPYRDRGLVFRHVVLDGAFATMPGTQSAPALRRRFRRAIARARGPAWRRR